jgi:hypothetical protein
LNVLQISFGKSTQDIFGEFDGKLWPRIFWWRCKIPFRSYSR